VASRADRGGDDRAPTDEDFTMTDITSDSSAHVSDDGRLAAAHAFLTLVVGCIAMGCGSIIVAVMVLVILSNIIDVPDSWNALLYLEAIGVVAFGISWLVKSGVTGLLSDHPTGGTAEPVPDSQP
jgi:hypothetical protein